MITLLTLFLEFFKIGLFAVGGGPATIPFLAELPEKYDWYSAADLADFIAISESTPGPVGINMATFAGYHAAGIPGSLVATAGLVLPSIIIILIIARFLQSFSKHPVVQGVFYGLRPAVCGLIVIATTEIFRIALFTGADGTLGFNYLAIGLAAVIFGLMQIKKLKSLHPAAWMGIAALVGILLKMS